MITTTNQGLAMRSSGSPVRDIMSRALTTIEEKESVAVAEQLMYQSGVRHLPVLRNGALVGILSDRDLLGLRGDGPLLEMPVREVMTSPVETTTPDASVDEASARMAARRIDCLPVVEGDKLVGIVTSTDILADRGRLTHKGTAGARGVPLARDIMHRRVMTISSDLAVGEAIQALVRAEMRYLPVVNAAGRVVGMFSDKELRSVLGDASTMLKDEGLNGMSGRTVGDVMRGEVVTVPHDASVLEIADKILDERQAALCVMDASERLIGVITYVDVLAALVGRRA